jgi:cytochrome c oxidase assembly protein subunit 11
MRSLHRRNVAVMLSLVGLVGFMTGLSFAAVPLYDLFCRVTGFGGTTQVATALPDRVLDRTIRVRFNADVNGQLDWVFRPEVREVTVRPGEPTTVLYVAQNVSKVPLVGTASYNVTPDKAGIHFAKIQCFCFTEQLLAPGERIEMPVTFFVDPTIADDPRMADVTTITLSYTFFRAASQQAAAQAQAVVAATPN